MGHLHFYLPDDWQNGYNISVFDWEEDGKDGEIAIPVEIVHQTLNVTDKDSLTTDSGTRSSILHAYILTEMNCFCHNMN